ncbi:S8 family serine peptidase [Flavobacterium acetivorans]|uniref:S8 family serine peptidase n=1 Tax=Flavobacterium acetivorans TaxID=2893883 RepID=UPI001E2F2D22|nr:S8 family serine peptidase [Flavobacterium sp. F-29]UFH35598.1 S8 family serine peptidase [Flavobacterium sp. F-29]
MKKTLLLLLLVSPFIWAQQRNPRQDMMNFVPGKIIVKLKDNVNAKVSYTSKGIGSTSENIGKLLGIEGKVSSSTVMFTQQSVEKSTMRKQTDFKDSRLKEVHSLKNTFVLDLKDKQENVLTLAENLKKNPSVEYAEPDYSFSVNDFTVDSKIYTEYEIKKLKNNTAALVAPNDPLYSQQSNISATHINEVWDTYGTGNGSQTIAILDTGVDYNHPDLKDNIWINKEELNGIEGYDDDGNGFIDDIRGWDFINNDNAPLDDNMHGTHVAGIAGAAGGNNLGIAGAVWNVKLMALKVFQSNGEGNASTIALAIQYASNNGAKIINMSFGSFVESITMRNALENAYATSVLVAAAGNNGLCIGPGRCDDGLPGMPFYPGAYSFVLGVQDLAKYSNYDQDGSIFSGYPNLLNYELKAPGSGIMSTVPDGGYRSLTGTSMAAPLVSGGIALYLQQKPNDSKELLFGNLINTSASFVNFKAAIEVTPTPELKILSAINKDNSDGQNGNGFLEPNEIIDILPLVKNYWGPTNDVRVGIEFAEFEDQTKATIMESEITIGSITAYASLQDLTKSLKIKIAPNVANNVNIKFNLKVWSGPNKDYLTSTEYVINVKNSILLFGVINQNMILTPDKEYLVSDNVIFSENATITILPGTVLKIADGKKISVFDNARVVAMGTKDAFIVFKNENNGWEGFLFNSGNVNKSILEFVRIEGIHRTPYYTYDNLFSNYSGSVRNLIGTNLLINDCSASSIFSSSGESFISKSNIYYNRFYTFLNQRDSFKNMNIINNDQLGGSDWAGLTLSGDSNSLNNEDINIFHNPVSFSVLNPGTSYPIFAYLGTSDISKYRREVQDALNNSKFSGLMNMNNISKIPYEENHGIVWKVLVNDKDSQDEYEQMDPVGIGNHEFKVYFNRAMDTNYSPQISYGVREPYTQKIISEKGAWSPDGKIYSVTHEVKIGVADGINRIRVQGARDLDYFDIPVEDYRFNMLVQSAGSASVGFGATPGLGKIALDWDAPSGTVLEDVLGYNMYRYKANTNGTFTEPVKINQTLIDAPTYTDFDVLEGKTYYYKYKILRTSFEETDYSMTVASSPLTSKLGDGNGDLSVNVMDLVQSVDYILGNNPTPFIFKAADVNADQSINVLDIVGTVDIILNPKAGRIASTKNKIAYYSKEAVGDAVLYWEGNDLFVESKHAIGGLQLAFNTDFVYSKSDAITSFESISYQQDNQKVIMIYSFNGLAIPAGKTKLLTKNAGIVGLLDINKAVVGMPNGNKLNALYNKNAIPDIIAPLQTNFSVITSLSPNPTSGTVNIEYYLPEKMDNVTFSVFDLLGQRVWNQNHFKNTSGYSTANLELNSLSNNIYILVMDVERNGELKDRIVKKIIVKK